MLEKIVILKPCWSPFRNSYQIRTQTNKQPGSRNHVRDDSKAKGFTLIELLVVVLIIGILSAVALPQYTNAVEKSRAAEAQTLLNTLAEMELVYKLANSVWAYNLEDLDVTLPISSSEVHPSAIVTKNFVISGGGRELGARPGITLEATRANNGQGRIGADYYQLKLRIADDGTITRKCNGAGCKRITNGRTCSTNSTNNQDWCYEEDAGASEIM